MLYRLSYAGTELDSGDLRKIVVIIRTIPGTDNRLRLPSSPESGSGTPVILMSHKPMTLYHDRHAASPGGNFINKSLRRAPFPPASNPQQSHWIALTVPSAGRKGHRPLQTQRAGAQPGCRHLVSGSGAGPVSVPRHSAVCARARRAISSPCAAAY